MSPFQLFARWATVVTVLASAAISGTSVASAQTQIGSDIDGSATFETVGRAFDISDLGTRVAVGVGRADEVRVYDLVNGAWTPAGSPIRRSRSDAIGGVVAISASGSRVLYSSPTSPADASFGGLVAVADFVNGTWVDVAGALTGLTRNQQLGRGLAMTPDGGRIAVGGANSPTTANTAFVRVYDVVPATADFVQVGPEITAPTVGTNFGTTLALSADGTRVVIGDQFAPAGGINRGAVYVYDLVGGTWQLVGARLVGDRDNDKYGIAVDISADGSRIAVGAYDYDAGANATGLIRVYDLVGGAWQQAGADIAGTSADDQFGLDLRLSSDGTRVSGSARGADLGGNNTGAVRYYDFAGGGWQLAGAIAGERVDDAVSAVAMTADGTRIALGSLFNNDAAVNAGNVRVFDVPAGPLPVELTAFAASAKTRHVALAWTTASERGASHFAVERSGDGAAWAAIGAVAAAGDADAVNDYAFSDGAPLAGANYYRLRQVDVDGAEALSAVEVVHFGAGDAGLADVVAYPNPARAYVALAGLPEAHGPGGPGGPGAVTARLLDVSGREVAVLGFGASRMSLAGVPAGVYALVVESGPDQAVRRIIVEAR